MRWRPFIAGKVTSRRNVTHQLILFMTARLYEYVEENSIEFNCTHW